MGVIQVDLGENSGVIGAGAWMVEVQDSKIREQSNGKALVVRCKVTEPEEFAGAAHFEGLPLEDPSVGFLTDRFLRALGIEVPTEKSERAAFTFDDEALVGRSAVVVLEAQEENPEYTTTRGVYSTDAYADAGIELGAAS